MTIPACIYREYVAITKSLTLVASPGAEIRGSDIWTGWTASGASWVSSKSVPSLYNPLGSCESGNRCHWPEQVFIDGQPQVQVATTATPATGEFRLDGSRRIVLGTNPAGRTVEVSVRQKWLWVGASDVTVRGFRMQHAASWAQGGGLQVGGEWVGAVHRVRIEGNTLAHSHGRDLTIAGGGNGHRILDNDISHAGCVGIGAGASGSDWVIRGNNIHHNATEGFSAGWESGGIKLLFIDGLLVEDNDIHHNSRGFWNDTGSIRTTLRNNRIHDNRDTGVLIEASHYVTVSGNAVWENGWGGLAAWGWGAGIAVSSSDHVQVTDNVVAWSPDGIAVMSQNRADDADHVEIRVSNNVIAMAPKADDTSAFANGWLQDWAGVLFSAASNNGGSGNTYWYPSAENGRVRFGWEGPRTTLSGFAGTPAETTSSYLSTSSKDSLLAAKGVPTTPVSR